jgi:hypothetical protein
VGIELLDGVREKLVRADAHIQAVEIAEAEYVVSETYGVRRQHEEHIPEKSGRPGLTWRADLNPPPPLRIAVLCGDFVHNLRSALDHLATALVIENGGTPREDPPFTHFPIYEERLTKLDEVRDVTIVGGISQEAEFLLDAVQPYQRVDDPTLHPLWLLHRLWNIDKHRTLNVVGVSLGKLKITFEEGRTGSTRAEPFADGHLLYWVLEENDAYDPDANPTVEYTPTLAFRDVAAGPGKDPVPVVDLLRELRNYVRYDVVGPFARLCFGGEVEIPEPIF